MDTSRITVKSVLNALDRQGCDPVPPDLFRGPGAQELSDALTAFDRAAENSPANRLLRDMGTSEENEAPPETSEDSEAADGENGAEAADNGGLAQKPRAS
jgi:hypothetical protein